MTGGSQPTLRSGLSRAMQLEASGQVLQAELLYVKELERFPGDVDASARLAHLAMQRGDSARAVSLLRDAVRVHPTHIRVAIDLAIALANSERIGEAITALEAGLQHTASYPPAWLLLGQLRQAAGDADGALKAAYQAVTRAQRAGQWKDAQTTPPHLLDAVVAAVEQVRVGHRQLFYGAFDDLRQQYGAAELARVDRALSGYLRDWDATPTDERQRPKFFFFPGLPNTPYHDPELQPWASRLRDAFPQIRAEAVRILEEDRRLPNFVPDTARVEDYVSGEGEAPSWEAFFFYRRGERFDANHRRAPDTSAVLESIELCRIAEQAPEILFSVLKPGSHINAHHGVSNVRLVMHLPLVVPPDCALNLVDRGEHRWQEGRLVMFDDTFLHEAWNRSDRTRIVLLMDCWNPHLTPVEKLAVRQLIETIGGLHEADRAPKAARPYSN
jgi:aspartate beta-hydroxylase